VHQVGNWHIFIKVQTPVIGYVYTKPLALAFKEKD